MQKFLQRVQNQIANWFVRVVLMNRMLAAKQRELVKETGRSWKTYETGISTAAALIVTADWGLQFPAPMPPKVHVSLCACTNSNQDACTDIAGVCHVHHACKEEHCVLPVWEWPNCVWTAS